MITWSRSGDVVEVRLGYAPCNEIGLDVLSDLERLLESSEIQGARALVIYSAQPKGFCAGADLRQLYQQTVDRPVAEHVTELRAFLDRIHRVMDRLDALPMTTVAAIHGVCFGGGFELALACDLRVVDRTARVCFPELRLGIVPGFGGIPRLRRELPAAVVRDLLLTGRSLNAKRAVELGLATQMVTTGQALEVARRVATQAALFDGQAMAAAKAMMKQSDDAAFRAELLAEKEHFVRLFQRPEAVDALKRFVESSDRMPYLPQGMGKVAPC
jgi:enoyl-CoA hydratase/carnithine racemase